MLPQRKHICLSTQEEAAYFHSVLTSLSSGLIKMSKEIIRLCIYRTSSKILRVIYTCGPFTFSLFIPHVREAIHFPPEVEQKSQLSILVNLSHISSSSSTASRRKTRRGEKKLSAGVLALAVSSSVIGSYAAEGISHTTMTSVVAAYIETCLQVLSDLAGTLIMRQPHSHKLQGSLITYIYLASGMALQPSTLPVVPQLIAVQKVWVRLHNCTF